MPATRLGVTSLVLIVCSACSSSSSGGGLPNAGGSSPLPSASACPSPTGSGAAFPAGAAARVPHPSFAQSARYLPRTTKGERVLRFTTAMPLHDAAAFVQAEYPPAGYRLTGGDAEAHEADILWAHGKVAGKTRLSGITACSTTWTVAALPPGVDTSEADGH